MNPTELQRWWWKVDERARSPIDEELGLLADDVADAKTLEALADVPCLVLLGDPGSGKTTAVSAACRALGAASVKARVRALGAMEHADDLRDAIRDALTVARGGHAYHLYLDGLDELVTSIRRLSEKLVDELHDLDALRNLRLRIVCRGAALPDKLPEMLANVYGRERVAVYTLLPLRRVDVERVVRDRRSEVADELLPALTRLPLAPLAARPLTLKLLLDQAGEVRAATTAYEVIDGAVPSLVAEPNLARPGGTSKSLPRRRELACALALVSLLAGRPRIHVNDGAGPTPIDAITMRDLDGFATPEEVSEFVRSAPLFDEGSFFHRSIVEHLAAEGLARAVPNESPIAKLFLPGGVSARVVPQVRGLAAQLAARRRFFDELLPRDPLTLLDVDPSFVDDTQRARLIDAVLARGEDLGALGRWSEVGEHLARFSHPAVAAQLQRWFSNTRETDDARAISLSFASHLPPQHRATIAASLAAFAVDAAQPLYLRVQATRAVRRLDDAGAIRALLPLLAQDAASPRATDQDEAMQRDDLVGVALEALWPHWIDAATMFAALKPPRREHYFGAHQYFASITLPKLLTTRTFNGAAGDVAVHALRWCTESFEDHIFWPPDELVAAALALTVTLLPDAVVSPALFDYIAASSREHKRPGEQLVRALATVPIGKREARRWDLLDLVVPRCETTDEGAAICFEMLHLLSADDAHKLLDRVERTPSSEGARIWAELASRVLNETPTPDVSVVERVYGYIDAPESLARASLSWLWTAVSLDDPHVQRRRKQAQEALQSERLRQEREAQRAAWISELVTKAIGGDLDAFWQLIPWSHSRISPDGLTERLAPGPIIDSDDWKGRSKFEHRALLVAASEYIRRQTVDAVDGFGGNSVPWSALAGRQAFVMLASCDEERFAAIEASSWRRWLPALLAPWVRLEVPERVLDVILQRLYAAAPSEYRRLVGRLLQALPGGDPSALEVALPVLDGPFLDDLVAFAHREDVSRSTFQQLLRGVATHSESAAERLALDVLARDWEALDESAARAAVAAAWLLATRPEAAWRELRARFEGRPDRGMEVVQATDHLRGHHRSPDFAGATTLAEFYAWGRQALVLVPRDAYPKPPRVAPHDTLAWMLPSVLDRLVGLGTVEGLAALGGLRRQLPDDARMPLALVDARERYLENMWRGWPVRELIETFCQPRSDHGA